MALEIDCQKDIGFLVDEKRLLQAEPGQMDGPTAMVSESPMPCLLAGLLLGGIVTRFQGSLCTSMKDQGTTFDICVWGEEEAPQQNEDRLCSHFLAIT